MKKLFFLYLTILSFTAFPKENNDEPYLVKTKDFHVNNFSINQINLGITAVIYNPYKVKVNLDEILIDVLIGDKKLGTITEAADIVKIKKESAFDLPLKIGIKTSSTVSKFFTEGAKMVLLGQKIRVDFKGYVKVKALGFIPIKVKINQYEYFTMKDILNSSKDTTKTSSPKDPKITTPSK